MNDADKALVEEFIKAASTDFRYLESVLKYARTLDNRRKVKQVPLPNNKS